MKPVISLQTLRHRHRHRLHHFHFHFHFWAGHSPQNKRTEKRIEKKENAIQIFFNWMQRRAPRRWWGCPIIIVDPKTKLPIPETDTKTQVNSNSLGLAWLEASSTNCWDYLFMEIYLGKSRRVNAPRSQPYKRSAIILDSRIRNALWTDRERV